MKGKRSRRYEIQVIKSEEGEQKGLWAWMRLENPRGLPSSLFQFNSQPFGYIRRHSVRLGHARTTRIKVAAVHLSRGRKASAWIARGAQSLLVFVYIPSLLSFISLFYLFFSFFFFLWFYFSLNLSCLYVSSLCLYNSTFKHEIHLCGEWALYAYRRMMVHRLLWICVYIFSTSHGLKVLLVQN